MTGFLCELTVMSCRAQHLETALGHICREVRRAAGAMYRLNDSEPPLDAPSTSAAKAKCTASCQRPAIARGLRPARTRKDTHCLIDRHCCQLTDLKQTHRSQNRVSDPAGIGTGGTLGEAAGRSSPRLASRSSAGLTRWASKVSDQPSSSWAAVIRPRILRRVAGAGPTVPPPGPRRRWGHGARRTGSIRSGRAARCECCARGRPRCRPLRRGAGRG